MIYITMSRVMQKALSILDALSGLMSGQMEESHARSKQQIPSK